MAIKVLLFDLARVVLFPRDPGYKGELNFLHRQMNNSLNYKPQDYFEFDMQLLEYLKEIPAEVEKDIFTSGTVQNAIGIKETIETHFKRMFSSELDGLSKKDPNSYKTIAGKLGVVPEEIVFVDDNKENVEAAKMAGLTGIVYTEYHSLRDAIEQALGR